MKRLRGAAVVGLYVGSRESGRAGSTALQAAVGRSSPSLHPAAGGSVAVLPSYSILCSVLALFCVVVCAQMPKHTQAMPFALQTGTPRC